MLKICFLLSIVLLGNPHAALIAKSYFHAAARAAEARGWNAEQRTLDVKVRAKFLASEDPRKKAVMQLDDNIVSFSEKNTQAVQQDPWKPTWEIELDTEIGREVENGFQSRFDLPPDQFKVRLNDILKRGNEDPARAQLIANGFGWDGGFTSRVNMFINELAMAMYFDRSISVCNSTCMFETTSVYYDLNLAVYNDPFRKEEQYTWRYDLSKNCRAGPQQAGRSTFAPNFLGVDFQYITDLKRFLLQSVMILKPTVQEKIANVLREAGFGHDKKFIGVHIRHGDKKSESPLIPFDTYAEAVTEALGARDIDRSVYIASDDPDAHAAMKELLPNDVEIWQQFDNGSSSREYEDDSVFSLLVDLEALKMSEVFIGTHSSNIGSFIFHGRPASKESISLDVKWEVVPTKSSDAMWHGVIARD